MTRFAFKTNHGADVIILIGDTVFRNITIVYCTKFLLTA